MKGFVAYELAARDGFPWHSHRTLAKVAADKSKPPADANPPGAVTPLTAQRKENVKCENTTNLPDIPA